MARAEMIGVSDVETKLKVTAEKTPFVAEKMLLAGAAVLADEVSRRLRSMFPDARYRLPSAMGITPVGHDSKGNYNIKIGFGGYQQMVTDAKGRTRQMRRPQPYQVIARVVENGRQSGPLQIKARPFMSPAVRATKSSVSEAMEKAAEKTLNDIQKGL